MDLMGRTLQVLDANPAGAHFSPEAQKQKAAHRAAFKILGGERVCLPSFLERLAMSQNGTLSYENDD